MFTPRCVLQSVRSSDVPYVVNVGFFFLVMVIMLHLATLNSISQVLLTGKAVLQGVFNSISQIWELRHCRNQVFKYIIDCQGTKAIDKEITLVIYG